MDDDILFQKQFGFLHNSKMFLNQSRMQKVCIQHVACGVRLAMTIYDYFTVIYLHDSYMRIKL